MICQFCDNMTKLENVKDGQISKNKKMWNLLISKTQEHNSRIKTAKNKLNFNSVERKSVLCLLTLSYKLREK